MTLADQALDALLKRLHLANTRRAWRDLAQRAEQEEWTYRALLALVVSEESAQRPQTRIARLVRRARVPFLKTVDDFNVLCVTWFDEVLLLPWFLPKFPKFQE